MNEELIRTWQLKTVYIVPFVPCTMSIIPNNLHIGPLFFLIYINDLPGMIKQISSPRLFADDTNIICVHHNTNLFNKKIEEILLKINKWFQANSLILNFNKTKFIQFSTKLNLDTLICTDYEHTILETNKVQAFWALL